MIDSPTAAATSELLRAMIDAAGADPVAADRVVDDAGMDAVADAVATEMRIRADLEMPPTSTAPPVAIALRWHHRSAVVERRIRTGAAPADDSVSPDAVVEQDLTEVIRGLFGPRGLRSAATRVVRWRDLDTPGAFAGPLPAYDAVRRLLDGIDDPYAVGLAELCVRHGSDKWGLHQYPRHYERYLEPVRDRPLIVLEIGVGGYTDSSLGGASLRVWRRYLPRALIHGVDVTDKTALSEPRMTVLTGDQASPDDLARVLSVTGPPDVVIDDGSHVSADQLTTFSVLFPALRPGGLYVLEDLQTSYWTAFGGRPDAIGTTIEFLTGLVDGLNHEEIDGRTPCDTDTTVSGVHLHHNLAVVEKGVNLEGGAPSWIPR